MIRSRKAKNGAVKAMEVELAEELRKRGFVVFGGH
jgi:hypothetical protein